MSTIDAPVKGFQSSSGTAVTVGNPSYVVLTDNDSHSWVVLSTEEAGSADTAIRQAVMKLDADEQPGTYVAVPTRSWRPVTVSAVQSTVLKLDPT